MLITSGMSIYSAITAIKQEIKSQKLLGIIDDIEDDITAGISVSKSLENSKLLPDHIISLIKIGEQSGSLPESLEVIAEQQQKERIFQSKLRLAMTYPAIVMGLTIAIAIGITWFILPRLSSVFDNLNLKLPFTTKLLIWIGDFVEAYGVIFFPVAIAVVFALGYLLFSYKKTKFIGQKIILSFPGVKNLIQETELARFGFILSTLVSSGIPVVDSLRSLSKAASFKVYKDFYKFMADNIDKGDSFSQVFKMYNRTTYLLPVPVIQMIISSEKSGNFIEALAKVGHIYENKLDTTSKNLTIIMEPILLIVVWVGVVFVAMAVIMPIYGLIGGLDQETSATPPSNNQVIEQKTPAE